MSKLRMADSIAENLLAIQQRVKGLGKNQRKEPLLVAVSKTKPVEAILEAYQAGQRHFGENYANEIAIKAKDQRILSSCPDIRWHFIGHLQRKAVNKVIVKNLHVIETIDSIRIAEALNEGWKKKKASEKLKVMLELNTSGEASKHGIKAEEVVDAAKFLKEKCDQLHLSGLMTIGSATNSLQNVKPNPDFKTLIDCRKRVSEALGFNPDELELSMGMSNDYEHAVEMGSTEVRVGSAIFGNRPYPPNADVGDSGVNHGDSAGSSDEEKGKSSVQY